MSLQSVLHEVENLSEDEKLTLFEVLQEHFAQSSDTLNAKEMELVRTRLEHYYAHPETAISLEELKEKHGL